MFKFNHSHRIREFVERKPQSKAIYQSRKTCPAKRNRETQKRHSNSTNCHSKVITIFSYDIHVFSISNGFMQHVSSYNRAKKNHKNAQNWHEFDPVANAKAENDIPKVPERKMRGEINFQKTFALICERDLICRNGTWWQRPMSSASFISILLCGLLMWEHKKRAFNVPAKNAPKHESKKKLIKYILSPGSWEL